MPCRFGCRRPGCLCVVCRPGVLYLRGKEGGESLAGQGGVFDGLAVAGSDRLRYRGTGQGPGGSPQFRPQRQFERRRDTVGAQPPPPLREFIDPRKRLPVASPWGLSPPSSWLAPWGLEAAAARRSNRGVAGLAPRVVNMVNVSS